VQLQAEIARIEPIERRARWQAVVDGDCSETDFASLRRRLAPPVRRVEAALQQSQWLAGAAYSIADIDAFAMLDPLTELAPEVVNERETPRVAEFLQRMHDRPAVRSALSRSRSGSPRSAFVPGAEGSRWG
jgi:glutathione S-transferase